jgi:threonine/homoserine/homoserine lactone efflux protein
MFEYSSVHWTAFFTATLLLTVSPGPDIAFMLGQTVKGGTRAGFAAMFGIWAGAFCHVLMAALGLSAIIATSAEAFSIVKWVGAAYLIWLGNGAICLYVSVNRGAGAASVYGGCGGYGIALGNHTAHVFDIGRQPQFVSQRVCNARNRQRLRRYGKCTGTSKASPRESQPPPEIHRAKRRSVEGRHKYHLFQ